MQRTARRAAADAERYAHRDGFLRSGASTARAPRCAGEKDDGSPDGEGMGTRIRTTDADALTKGQGYPAA
jgi:hypothetical protein